MLLQFNFSNHKSFREETSLDLTAAGISELKNHVFEVGNEKILPITAIYGANASGKSNVIDAFNYMQYYVMTSFVYDLSDKVNKNSEFIEPPKFAFDKDSRDKVSLYEVYFIIEESNKTLTYNYGFTVDNKGIVEEWLRSKAKTTSYRDIFYRNTKEGTLELYNIPKKQRENIKISLRDETLVVSLGDRLKVSILEKIYDWFDNCEVIDYGSPVEVLVREKSLPVGFTEDESVREDMVNYLSTFDSDIIGFNVEKAPKDSEGNERYSIETVHRTKNNGGTFKIPLAAESAGTLKMFSLYQYIMNALKNGGLLFIDELNTRLHPIIVANIINSFSNREINKTGAQLIITTHDVIHLDTNYIRRDEIWFTEKVNGQSELYSLADFEDIDGKKIRKDENYLKNYLVGKYGAIPIIKSITLPQEVYDEKKE